MNLPVVMNWTETVKSEFDNILDKNVIKEKIFPALLFITIFIEDIRNKYIMQNTNCLNT